VVPLQRRLQIAAFFVFNFDAEGILKTTYNNKKAALINCHYSVATLH
jgi:hypothetical protein